MVSRTAGFEKYTLGYNDLAGLIGKGWKIDWLVGVPRSGTNTTVNIMSETPAVDGLHLRGAFYFHQGLAIPPDEHFDIICGLIAEAIEKRAAAHPGEEPSHILIKDMAQPFTDEQWNKWLPLVANFMVTLRDPHSTSLSLITALANDEHIKKTPPETPIYRNGELFKPNIDEYARNLRDDAIEGLLAGDHTDLKYGHWNNMNIMLDRITRHVKQHPEKKFSIFDFGMAQCQPELFLDVARNSDLGTSDTMLKGWTKAVALNFSRVSSSQFSTHKFPPRTDPRKDRVWEGNVLDGPFQLLPPKKDCEMEILTEPMQEIISDHLLPFYLDALRHPNVVGPATPSEFMESAQKAHEGSTIADWMPVTYYAYGLARFGKEQGALREYLDMLKSRHPEHAKAFTALDKASVAKPDTQVEISHRKAISPPHPHQARSAG